MALINPGSISSGIHAVVVPHTHWDREWYRPFQEFRMRLVQTVDLVIDLLDKGEYPYFLLDGQTVVLNDYLQIRPHQEDKLRELIKAGRLGIGPWYVLMDEFLVSGESLIRNLLMGRQMMDLYGAPPPRVGYLPDMFGHIAQMPQILKKFGLDRAVLWRGVAPKHEHFSWQGPDGSDVTTVFLPQGYHNVILAEEQSLEDRLVKVKEFFDHHHGRNILFPCGSDHLLPQPELPRIVAQVQAKLGPGQIIRMGSLVEAVEMVKPEDEVPGELRYPTRAYILPDVASTRMYLKQWNAICQTLLERYAEPLATLTWLAGRDYPYGFLFQAWQTLLLNHPHDSISGCSIDEVHRENVTRYQQVEQLGEGLVKRCIRQLAPRSDEPGLFLYNPTGWPRTEWVRAEVNWPRDGAPEAIHFVTPDGQIPALYLLEKEDTEVYIGESERVPDWHKTRRFDVVLKVEDLPPHGFATLEARAGAPAKKDEGAIQEVREELKELQQVLEVMLKGGLKGTRKYLELSAQHGQLEARVIRATLPQVAVDETGIENELLHLGRDGDRLVMMDKTSGHLASDVHFFLDGGDAGDEYNWSPPEGDEIVRSRIVGSKPLLQSAALCRWEVEFALDLPDRLSPDRKLRIGKGKQLRIRSVFSLSANSRRIEVRTELTNQHQDHRLRLACGTGLTGGGVFAWADTTFAVVRRPVTRAKDVTPLPVAKLAEYQATTFPQQSFTAAENDTEGVAVLVRGLPQAEVIYYEKQWVVAVTLLRAVGWLSRGDLRTRGGEAGPHFETPDAQCLGPQSYDYALIPYSGNWLRAGIPAEALLFNAPIRAQEIGGLFDFLSGGATATPDWLSVADPRLVVSAVKRSEPPADDLVLRIVNPTPETIEAEVRLTGPFMKVFPADLREQPGRKALGNPWTQTWGPYAIETFVVTLDR